jgi:ElaB/YqjD/DUF883 family membrane-anchored ribosome-binding protein
MTMTTTPTESAKMALESDLSDVDQLKENVRAIRRDFASLAATTGKLAAGQLREQSKRARALADTAGDKAGTYRDLISEKVKDHPFASMGAAALLGIVLSSMRRR